MGTPIAPCPCPEVQIAALSAGIDSVSVTVLSGGPVKVTLGLVSGTQYEQHGDGPFLFEGLEVDTVYSVVAINECGNTATSQVTTDPCPGIALTETSDTTTSVTVQLIGGPAILTLGDATASVAANGSHTFVGLAPDTEYTVSAVSACGSTALLQVATEACPPVVITQGAVTTHAITLTVASGGPATITLNGVTKAVNDGASATFTGLTPDADYTAQITSACDGKVTQFDTATAACPAVVVTQGAVTTTSVTLTVASGGPATVTVGGVTKLVADGASVTFTELTPGTDYTAQIVSQCGGATTQFDTATAPCPAVVVTQGAVTTDSITLTVASGGPATITLNGVAKIVANGASATFTGLTPNTDYTAQIVSACDGDITFFDTATPDCPAVTASATSPTPGVLTVTVLTGAPAAVTVNGITRNVAADGGSVTFTGLTVGTTVSALVASACGNEGVFAFEVVDCPQVAITLSAVTETSFTVTVNAGGPADLEVRDVNGNLLRAAYAVAVSQAFTGLPDGEQLYVTASSGCGSTVRVPVETAGLPCASMLLKGGGYGYVDGDLVDAAATVVIPATDYIPAHNVYPTAGPGHTAPVYNEAGDTILGYAANKSKCAFEKCCDEGLKGCYLKCDDELLFFKDSGIVAGAGVCIGVDGLGYVEGRAIWQARDDTFILGGGNTSAGGATAAYLQETYTNPWDQPALLHVDVQTQANTVAANGPAPGGMPLLGKHVTVIHNIGEVLAVSPPNFGGNSASIPSNWAWTNLETSNPSVHWNDSTAAYGYKPLSQMSNSMFFEKVLLPGESVTLYSQFWAIFYPEGVFEYVVHGGMRPTAKFYRNTGVMP